MVRHFLEVDDLTPAELATVLDMASHPATDLVLARRGVALLFEKPSARTRHSMEIATIELGGHPLYVRPEEVGLDTRESVEDVTRVLMGYHAVIAGRVFEHSKLERMAAVSSVPVVNLLSDDAHPIQVLADLLRSQARRELFDSRGRQAAQRVGAVEHVGPRRSASAKRGAAGGADVVQSVERRASSVEVRPSA